MLMEEMQRCIQWLRDQVEAAGAEGLVVGLSGGIDSALVGYLIAKACPRNCLGLYLPCGSHPQDREDALLSAKAANLPFLELDLSRPHSWLWEGANNLFELDPAARRDVSGNLRARLRMAALYTVAGLKNYLVVGTDNKSEYHLSYFTKYGDGGVDLLPIVGLTKSQVYAWAKEAGLPQRLLQKPPSAGLWPGQTDEAELGISYNAVDRYLEGEPVLPHERERIEELHRRTEHKRKLPAMFIP